MPRTRISRLPLLGVAAMAMVVPGSGRPAPAADHASSAKELKNLDLRVSVEETERGCNVSVRARNQGLRTTAISRDSQVRLRSYPWKKLGLSVWLNPGQSRVWTYSLLWGCEASRRYRFLVKEFDSNRNLLNQTWYYYPSSRSFTDNESFNIGDLSRFF